MHSLQAMQISSDCTPGGISLGASGKESLRSEPNRYHDLKVTTKQWVEQRGCYGTDTSGKG